MNLGMPKSPSSASHASLGFVDSSTASAHFIARCKAWRPSIPNTYRGRRKLVFNPVICRAQPQSDPGTGCGTPIVSTTGFPFADWNTRRAAIRRIVRGAAKDLLIRLSEMVSGGGAECLDAAQPVLDIVPTGNVLVHHPSLACSHERATGGKPFFALDRRRRLSAQTRRARSPTREGCPPSAATVAPARR
jgi:hypothetical protein